MPRLIVVGGKRKADRTRLIEEIIPRLVKRGLKVGVVVHRLISAGEETGGGETERYSRAGASQVMITRGKEIGFNTKRGVLTPLQRVAARYFNAVDLLLADGYFDPVARIEVDLTGNPRRIKTLDHPNLIAAVFNRFPPDLPVPTFSLVDLEELIKLIENHLC